MFVIGGAQLYADALPRADRLLLTEIHADFDGDTFLPAPEADTWAEASREAHPASGTRPFQFDFVDYRRR
jgi:dihydrofolate reductase